MPAAEDVSPSLQRSAPRSISDWLTRLRSLVPGGRLLSKDTKKPRASAVCRPIPSDSVHQAQFRKAQDISAAPPVLLQCRQLIGGKQPAGEHPCAGRPVQLQGVLRIVCEALRFVFGEFLRSAGSGKRQHGPKQVYEQSFHGGKLGPCTCILYSHEKIFMFSYVIFS